MKNAIYLIIIFAVIVAFTSPVDAAKSDYKFTKVKNGVMFDKGTDTTFVNVEKYDKEIKISSQKHEKTHIKVNRDDIEAIRGNADLLLVSHFNDEGVNDWEKVITPTYENGYIEIEVEFSEVTITPYVSIITNWNFETWSSDTQPSNWYVTTTGGYKSSDAAFGTYSYGINGNTSQPVCGLINQSASQASATGWYDIGAFVKVSGRAQGQLNIDLKGTGVDTNGIKVTGNTGGEWVYYTTSEYITPSGTPIIRIFTDLYPNTGSIWEVDGVWLSPKPSTVTANETNMLNETTSLYEITQNITYTPSSIIANAVYIVDFDADLDGRDDVVYTATIDGVSKTTYGKYGYVYVDVSGLSASSHIILVKAAFTQLADATITMVGDDRATTDANTSKSFNFTTNNPLSYTIWYVNGVPMNTTGQELVYALDDGSVMYNVSAIAVTGNNYTNMLTWTVYTRREMATSNDTVPLYDETNYNNLMTNFTKFDSVNMSTSAVTPFTDLIGRSFYLIMFVMPFVLLWQKQQKLTIPAVLALITGCLFIGFVPDQYRAFITYAVILSFAVNLFFMGRERM